jgi:hypothetical protein
VEYIRDDIKRFATGCEHLLGALAHRSELTDAERELISFYCEAIMAHAWSLRDEYEIQ